MSLRGAAAVCVTLLAAGPAVAERPLDDPGYWLSRIAESATQAHYHGEVIYRHADRVEAMEIVRRGGPDEYFERLLMLDGVPREVLRDGKSVTCVLPDGRASLAGQRVPRNPFPGAEWRYTDEVARHYEFLDLGDGRVAGRSCKVIGVRPRDTLRYGYRLWVDTDSGLLLRADTVADDGEVVEQVAFTRVRIPDELDARHLDATLTGETVRWTVDTAETGAESQWRIGAVPEGFSQQAVRTREHGAVQHVLSDGLATVSVFVAPVREDKPRLAGTSRMGAVSAFGTVIDGHQVTVVGEVPVATVRSIGESLVPGVRP